MNFKKMFLVPNFVLVKIMLTNIMYTSDMLTCTSTESLKIKVYIKEKDFLTCTFSFIYICKYTWKVINFMFI